MNMWGLHKYSLRFLVFPLIFSLGFIAVSFAFIHLQYPIYSKLSHSRSPPAYTCCDLHVVSSLISWFKAQLRIQGQLLLPCMCCSHGFHMEQIVKFSLVATHVPSARVTAGSQSQAGLTSDVVCYWEEGFMGTVVFFSSSKVRVEKKYVLTIDLLKSQVLWWMLVHKTDWSSYTDT